MGPDNLGTVDVLKGTKLVLGFAAERALLCRLCLCHDAKHCILSSGVQATRLHPCNAAAALAKADLHVQGCDPLWMHAGCGSSAAARVPRGAVPLPTTAHDPGIPG